MKKLIIYFHGFNSSPQTDKVARLKQAFPDDYVYAFSINIDPDIATIELQKAIDFTLLDHLNEDIKVIFVGTSLGAWWANKMGFLYHCPVMLINPCEDPTNSLQKYDVDKSILNKFSPVEYHPEKDYYFIARQDEIITHPINWSWPNLYVYNSSKVRHQFNGPEFNDVIKVIKSKLTGK